MPSNPFLASLHVSIYWSRGTHKLACHLQWWDLAAKKYFTILNDLYYSEVCMYEGLDAIQHKCEA